MEEKDGKLPLGILRQAVMKLESFAGDIREAAEDEDIEPTDKENFEKMAEMAGIMMANIVNTVSRELGEEEFLQEEFDMDAIDEYPGFTTDVGDEIIDI